MLTLKKDSAPESTNLTGLYGISSPWGVLKVLYLAFGTKHSPQHGQIKMPPLGINS
jgi:hypothetical protein